MLKLVEEKFEFSRFSRLFKNGSISEITRVIDDGALDTLDLESLNAIYQVFRERFSVPIGKDNNKFFNPVSIFHITDSSNDPLLVVKSFSDKGISQARKDLIGSILGRLLSGSIEECIYLWEMGYLRYLGDECLMVNGMSSRAGSTLNKILNSSSVKSAEEHRRDAVKPLENPRNTSENITKRIV